MPITRIRIEGLLAAFPKLIGNETQHTFVETDAVRYLYSPLDQLYLIMITNKQSNIMEDMNTMLLLAKVVQIFLLFLVFSSAFLLLSSFFFFLLSLNCLVC